MKNKILYIAILFLCFESYSQNINSDSIVIIWPVEIEIDSADRNYAPVNESTTITRNPSEQQYDLNQYPIRLQKVQPRVPIYRITPPKLPPLSQGFAKVGFGNYTSPFVEGLVTNKSNTDNYRYGAYVRHFSSINGPVDKQNSGVSQNRLNLFGDYLKDDMVFSTSLDYQRSGLRFYGYPDSLEEVSLDDIKRVFNHINVQASASKVNANAGFVYNANLGFQYLSDNYNIQETDIEIDFQGEYRIDKYNKVMLRSSNSFGSISDSLNSRGRSVLSFNPYYSYYKKESRVKLDAGFNVAIENDTVAEMGRVHFYPHILVDVTLIKPPGFRVYAGIDGDIERNNWNNLYAQNPFLGAVNTLSHSNRALRFFGGVKATIHKQVTFDAGVSFSSYENLFFFVNDPTNQAEFLITYDTGTTTHTQFHGEVMYTYGKYTKAGVRVEANAFNTSSLEKAYHRPTFRATIMGMHRFNERLSLGGDIYVLAGMNALNVENGQTVDVTLDPIFDLSLRGEYKLTHRLASWTELNNLFNKEYQIYLQYPNKGINFLLGLNYTF